MLAEASSDALNWQTGVMGVVGLLITIVGYFIVRTINGVDSGVKDVAKKIDTHMVEDTRRFDDVHNRVTAEAERRAAIAGRVSRVEGKLKINSPSDEQ